MYDQPNNESFCNKLETVQYNVALLGYYLGTGSILGTSKVNYTRNSPNPVCNITFTIH